MIQNELILECLLFLRRWTNVSFVSVLETDMYREGLEYDMNMIFEIYHNWTQGCAAVAWLGAQVVSPKRKIR